MWKGSVVCSGVTGPFDRRSDAQPGIHLAKLVDAAFGKNAGPPKVTVNPLGHEAKIEWEMTEQDALDILTTIPLIQRTCSGASVQVHELNPSGQGAAIVEDSPRYRTTTWLKWASMTHNRASASI